MRTPDTIRQEAWAILFNRYNRSRAQLEEDVNQLSLMIDDLCEIIEGKEESTGNTALDGYPKLTGEEE